VPQRDMFLYLALQILFHYLIGIHVWSDALVQDFLNWFFLFFYTQFLSKIDMYNEPIDKNFLSHLINKRKKSSITVQIWILHL
jgi:hypothetical protein